MEFCRKTYAFFTAEAHAGHRTLLGGVLVHLCLGTLYLWGNLTTYVTAYLRQKQPGVTYADSVSTYALAIAFQALFMTFGGPLEKRVGPGWTCLIGGYILVLGVMCSAATKTLVPFVICYGCMFGLGVALAYNAPMMASMRHFPKRRGFVSGVIVAGFGGGSFIFNQVASLYVNPHNTGIDEKGDDDEYYDPDSNIADRVPSMFILLGSCYFVLISIGAFLVRNPKDYRPNTTEPGESLLSADDHHGPLDPDSDDSNNSLNNSNSIDSDNGGNHRRTGSDASADSDAPMVMSSSSSSSSAPAAVPVNGLVSVPIGSSAATDGTAAGSRTKSGGAYEQQAVKNEYIASHDTDARESSLCDDLPLFENRPDLPMAVEATDLLKHRLAWHVAMCFVLTTFAGIYFAAEFKVYGEDATNDDEFLAILGSIGSLFNAGGRVFWGRMVDYMGVRRTLLILASVFSFVIATYSFTTFNKYVFSLWTLMIFGLFGGNFAIYPTCTLKLFGERCASANYGLMFLFEGLSSCALILVVAQNHLMFLPASLVMAACTACGVVLVYLLPRDHGSLQIRQAHERRAQLTASDLSEQQQQLSLPPQMYAPDDAPNNTAAKE